MDKGFLDISFRLDEGESDENGDSKVKIFLHI